MATATFTQWALLALLNLPFLMYHVQAEDDRCTSVPNLSYIASPNACYLYYNCIDGNAYPLVCPDGLWFSMEQQSCVAAEQSDCTLTEPPVLPEAPDLDPSPLCDDVPNFSYVASPNSCQWYYQCIDRIAYLLSCPLYYWFDEALQRCGTRYDIQCDREGSTTTSLPTQPPILPETPGPDPSPLCDDVPNFRYVASPNSCQWYYQCIDRIAYLLSCPLYYWFDEELQRCGTRYDIQCDREGSTTTSLPTPPTVDPLELCDDLPDFTLVPSASFCDRYYSCFQGNPYPENCLPGLWFNPATLECDDPDNVECAALTERPTTSTTTTSPAALAYRTVRIDPAHTSLKNKSGVKRM